MGSKSEKTSKVNMEVFPSGPGDSMMVSEKMHTINSSKY